MVFSENFPPGHFRLRQVFENQCLTQLSEWDLQNLYQLAIDPETSSQTRPCRDRKSAQDLLLMTQTDFRKRYQQDGPYQIDSEWIIEEVNEEVNDETQSGSTISGSPFNFSGSISRVLNPPHRLSQESSVAWVGLEVAQAKNRGRGIGSWALREFERLCHSQKIEAVEAGIFQFNTRSIQFFEKNGYQEIGKSEDKFWYQGRLWPSIHYTKKLF